MSSFTGTPVRYNRETSMDLIGQLINLHRLPGESLTDVKARIIDAYIHRASSTYGGLVNGINRRLGIEENTGILIDVARDSDDLPVSRGLGLEVTSRYLTLYSDHIAGTVLQQFDLHDRAGPYFLNELISAINNVTGFEVVNWQADSYDKSMHLSHVDSKKLRLQQTIATGSRMQRMVSLDPYNYIVGSLIFPAGMNLYTEVTTTPVNEGEFMVDYDYGVFWTNRPMSGNVTYWYQKFPLFIRHSPVSISRFKDDEYLDLITHQLLNEDGALQDDMPTYEGADFLNELLAVAPMMWGE